MKKLLVAFILISGLFSCKKDKTEFADFDYTTGYFPYQYPVRTLVLGNYIYDNTNDNNHKFVISAAMGGVYENTRERSFDVEIATNLCRNALFQATGDTIRLMPTSYYSLNTKNKLTIPAGQINGGIEVQLTDAFFNDPLAIKLGYVIPMRIVSVSNLDSVLRGSTSKANADPRISALWDVQPKDFTMFAVNFINPYHGMYLHRGVSVVKNAAATVLETQSYRTPYIVDNEIWSLTTSGKMQVTIQALTHSALVPGSLKMNLNFAADGTCSISSATGSTVAVTGTGKFVVDAAEWGDKKRDAIYLNYQMVSGTNTLSATDTLVVRDRAVKLQLFTPVVF